MLRFDTPGNTRHITHDFQLHPQPSAVLTPRSLLVPLLYAFFTLLTSFAVVMGAYLLAAAVQDVLLAKVLRIVGIGCLILLVIDALLLLLALAIHTLDAVDRRQPPPRDAEGEHPDSR
jgi:hypothetical protein